jgi:hypothetical protein
MKKGTPIAPALRPSSGLRRVILSEALGLNEKRKREAKPVSQKARLAPAALESRLGEETVMLDLTSEWHFGFDAVDRCSGMC